MRNKTMGWTPGNSDNRIGAMLGIIGGLIQFMLNIQLPTDFWSKLMEAAITAGLCGFAGVLGKEIYKLLRNSLVAYFRNRKNKR